jgi:hypothetical protein
MAVQLAEKYEEERSMLARKVVELEKQVVKGRETSSDTVKDSGDDSVTIQQTRTHVDNKVHALIFHHLHSQQTLGNIIGVGEYECFLHGQRRKCQSRIMSLAHT